MDSSVNQGKVSKKFDKDRLIALLQFVVTGTACAPGFSSPYELSCLAEFDRVGAQAGSDLKTLPPASQLLDRINKIIDALNQAWGREIKKITSPQSSDHVRFATIKLTLALSYVYAEMLSLLNQYAIENRVRPCNKKLLPFDALSQQMVALILGSAHPRSDLKNCLGPYWSTELPKLFERTFPGKPFEDFFESQKHSRELERLSMALQSMMSQSGVFPRVKMPKGGFFLSAGASSVQTALPEAWYEEFMRRVKAEAEGYDTRLLGFRYGYRNHREHAQSLVALCAEAGDPKHKAGRLVAKLREELQKSDINKEGDYYRKMQPLLDEWDKNHPVSSSSAQAASAGTSQLQKA